MVDTGVWPGRRSTALELISSVPARIAMIIAGPLLLALAIVTAAGSLSAAQRVWSALPDWHFAVFGPLVALGFALAGLAITDKLARIIFQTKRFAESERTRIRRELEDEADTAPESSTLVAGKQGMLGLDELAPQVGAHLDRLGVARSEWLRVAKVAEEAGEVIGALIKSLPEEDLHAELADVFLAALGAADQLDLVPSQLIEKRWKHVAARSADSRPAE